MDDTEAVKILKNKEARIKERDRKDIANVIETLRSALYQTTAEAECLKQQRREFAEKTEKERKNYAELESCLHGMCWCCQNRGYSYAKLQRPEIRCVKKKREIPTGMRVINCPFWKFKKPEEVLR